MFATPQNATRGAPSQAGSKATRASKQSSSNAADKKVGGVLGLATEVFKDEVQERQRWGHFYDFIFLGLLVCVPIADPFLMGVSEAIWMRCSCMSSTAHMVPVAPCKSIPYL